MIQEQQLKDAFRIAEHRIAALEEVVRKLVNSNPIKVRHANFICVFCKAHSKLAFSAVEHEKDCLTFEARAVLEGK